MLQPGTTIGDKYRLTEAIGQGGMATVWRGEHTMLHRPVAVKFLEGVGTDVQRRKERFLREARLVGGIRHRHVVDVMDFGVTENGTPYMVMEYLEGQSLAERLEQDPPLTDREVLDIVAMTLGGLAAVHDEGIVHRDIKPENIFLVEDADGVFPKILDFGISRAFAGDDAKSLTHTGGVVGTPSYMSPEQARGIKDIDLRSDLFSVGVILYECVAGQLPFDSENPGDVMMMIANRDPHPIELARPDLPALLTDVIDRALARDRQARYQDAREMRDAVEAAMSEVGDGAPPPRRARAAPLGSPATVDVVMATPKTGEVPGLTTSRAPRRGWIWAAAAAVLVAAAVGAFALTGEEETTAGTQATDEGTAAPPTEPAPEAPESDPGAVAAAPAEPAESEPEPSAPPEGGADEEAAEETAESEAAGAESEAAGAETEATEDRAARRRAERRRAARRAAMSMQASEQTADEDGFIRSLDY